MRQSAAQPKGGITPKSRYHGKQKTQSRAAFRAIQLGVLGYALYGGDGKEISVVFYICAQRAKTSCRGKNIVVGLTALQLGGGIGKGGADQ